jgi:hypothetical protein
LNLSPAAIASLMRPNTARFQPSFVETTKPARMFVAPISRMRAMIRDQSP